MCPDRWGCTTGIGCDQKKLVCLVVFRRVFVITIEAATSPSYGE